MRVIIHFLQLVVLLVSLSERNGLTNNKSKEKKCVSNKIELTTQTCVTKIDAEM